LDLVDLPTRGAGRASILRSNRSGLALTGRCPPPATCVDDLADCGLRIQNDTCHLFGVVGPLIGPMRPPANDGQVTVIHHRQASGVQRFQ
jgi:hypothetical protein